MAFAQREMAATFMEGIDPDFRQSLLDWLEELFSNYSAKMAEAIEPDTKRRASLEKTLAQVHEGLLERLTARIDRTRDQEYTQPVLEAVEGLPKDELAAMAEALVNLTSFKRRVSLQDETVGGPVDVAVISKGDGLVWIKRKHYFRPELNPHYFMRFQSYPIGDTVRGGQGETEEG